MIAALAAGEGAAFVSFWFVCFFLLLLFYCFEGFFNVFVVVVVVVVVESVIIDIIFSLYFDSENAYTAILKYWIMKDFWALEEVGFMDA